MIQILSRWWRWKRCVTVFAGEIGMDLEVARGQGLFEVGPPVHTITRAHQICEQSGVDPALAYEAAVASVYLRYGAWKRAHGLGFFGAP